MNGTWWNYHSNLLVILHAHCVSQNSSGRHNTNEGTEGLAGPTGNPSHILTQPSWRIPALNFWGKIPYLIGKIKFKLLFSLPFGWVSIPIWPDTLDRWTIDKIPPKCVIRFQEKVFGSNPVGYIETCGPFVFCRKLVHGNCLFDELLNLKLFFLVGGNSVNTNMFFFSLVFFLEKNKTANSNGLYLQTSSSQVYSQLVTGIAKQNPPPSPSPTRGETNRAMKKPLLVVLY